MPTIHYLLDQYDPILFHKPFWTTTQEFCSDRIGAPQTLHIYIPQMTIATWVTLENKLCKFLVQGNFKFRITQSIQHHWESNLQPFTSKAKPIELTWQLMADYYYYYYNNYYSWFIDKNTIAAKNWIAVQFTKDTQNNQNIIQSIHYIKTLQWMQSKEWKAQNNIICSENIDHVGNCTIPVYVPTQCISTPLRRSKFVAIQKYPAMNVGYLHLVDIASSVGRHWLLWSRLVGSSKVATDRVGDFVFSAHWWTVHGKLA